MPERVAEAAHASKFSAHRRHWVHPAPPALTMNFRALERFSKREHEFRRKKPGFELDVYK